MKLKLRDVPKVRLKSESERKFSKVLSSGKLRQKEVLQEQEDYIEKDTTASTKKHTSSLENDSGTVKITIKPNDVKSLNIGELLAESVSLMRSIPDWPIEKWREYMNTVGAVPFMHLCKDTDRYYLLIYGAEYLRANESREQEIEGTKHLRFDKNYDTNAEQVALDGRTWGGVDEEGDITGDAGISHADRPVREQMEQAEKDNLDKHRPDSKPAAYTQPSDDPYIQKWRMAEKHARHTPRAEWEGKLDFEFEQMVKYCYSWLRDISEVPQPYPMETLDLWWPRPKLLENSPEGNERRNRIVEKLVGFWRKSVSQAGDGIDLTSQSYRVILAAMALEKEIERYANNYRNTRVSSEPGTGIIQVVPDIEIEKNIKKLAVDYFQAHFPVQKLGVMPGPLSTLDPDYVGYLTFCRKYNLEVGTILHEQEF